MQLTRAVKPLQRKTAVAYPAMNRPSDTCGKLYGRIALQPVGTAALARKIGQKTILFCRERLIFPVKKVRQISLCP